MTAFHQTKPEFLEYAQTFATAMGRATSYLREANLRYSPNNVYCFQRPDLYTPLDPSVTFAVAVQPETRGLLCYRTDTAQPEEMHVENVPFVENPYWGSHLAILTIISIGRLALLGEFAGQFGKGRERAWRYGVESTATPAVTVPLVTDADALKLNGWSILKQPSSWAGIESREVTFYNPGRIGVNLDKDGNAVSIFQRIADATYPHGHRTELYELTEAGGSVGYCAQSYPQVLTVETCAEILELIESVYP